MFAEVVSTLKDKNLHSMRIMACKKIKAKSQIYIRTNP